MLLFSLFQEPLVFIAFLVGLTLAISFHEFAHALVAYRLGDDTPKYTGRLTLNPLAHLDLVGTIFLFIAGFGWGKPVLYNPANLRKNTDEVLIAFSGPLTNLILAFVFALPYRIGYLVGVDPSALTTQPVYVFFNVLTELNIVLAVFNFLPIPPLDGSKLLYLFVSNKTKYLLERLGMPILFFILFLAYIFNFDFFGKILAYPMYWLLYLVRIFPAGIF